MNYAEDRRDRRARHGTDGLWNDYKNALDAQNHVLLGQTLRDVGWNRRALFHYAQALLGCTHARREGELDTELPNRVGDYAQMAELAGYPELGILAIAAYRGSFSETTVDRQGAAIDRNGWNGKDRQTWLSQHEAGLSSHCGCGDTQCGYASYTIIQWKKTALDLFLVDLKDFLEEQQQCIDNNTIALTAHGILAKQAKQQELPEMITLPQIFAFWTDSCDTVVDEKSRSYRPLPTTLQLLWTKLLYSVCPSLALYAVIHLPLRDNTTFCAAYKSHWAYQVFLRALVLGERIKPHRRAILPFYHIPIWDLLFGLDQRNDYDSSLCLPSNTERHRRQRQIHMFTSRLRTIATAAETPISEGQSHFYFAPNPANHHRPLYIAGDSHVLSLAWQTLWIAPNQPRLVVPLVVTGLKAWHVQSNVRFFTRANLDVLLQRFPRSEKTILVSAGEIDCREGLGGPALEGYRQSCVEDVTRTVSAYVQGLVDLRTRHGLEQLLVLPVAPQMVRSTGRATGQASRRETIQVWNKTLQALLPRAGVFFLDYADDVRLGDNEEYVLNQVYNADSTHMNSAFVLHLELAIRRCGCDMSLL